MAERTHDRVARETVLQCTSSRMLGSIKVCYMLGLSARFSWTKHIDRYFGVRKLVGKSERVPPV